MAGSEGRLNTIITANGEQLITLPQLSKKGMKVGIATWSNTPLTTQPQAEFPKSTTIPRPTKMNLFLVGLPNLDAKFGKCLKEMCPKTLKNFVLVPHPPARILSK